MTNDMSSIFGIPLDPLLAYQEQQAQIERDERRQAKADRFREPSQEEVERVLALRHGPNWKEVIGRYSITVRNDPLSIVLEDHFGIPLDTSNHHIKITSVTPEKEEPTA